MRTFLLVDGGVGLQDSDLDAMEMCEDIRHPYVVRQSAAPHRTLGSCWGSTVKPVPVLIMKYHCSTLLHLLFMFRGY